MRLVWESARLWTVLQGLVVVVQGVLPVATLYLTRQAVDVANRFLLQPAGARDSHGLLILLPWVGGVALVAWLCRALSALASQAQTEAVADHVQGALQRKAIEVDLACYETPAYYDQVRMVQAEAMSRPTSIVRNLTQLGVNALVLGSIGGVLCLSQGVLLPILLAAALPGALARMWNSRRWNDWRLQQSAAERYAGYLHLLLTALPFAKEIRLNGSGDELRRQFVDRRRLLRQSRLALMLRRAAVELAADALSAAAVIGGAAVIYARLQESAMTLGDLALLFSGFQQGRAAFSSVLGGFASLYEDSLFIGHFYDFLALPPGIRQPAHPKPMPRRIEQGIRLEHVSFRYPGTDRDVLRDVDLTVAAGEHTALVGENGSGKTTLVKLLCRLYDPTQGRILIDGTDIREFDLQELRQAYSVLFQDFVRYQMSAGENVRMGNVRLPSGDARIAEAARESGAAGAIERLPRGYETLLGRLFEGGAELSEGQWQRVALARVLVRRAPILVLDEPTSSLDAKAEREFLESLMRSAKGRTALVISHRFTTVRAASRILVMADGRLVESGSHDELIKLDRVYAGLFALHSGA